jgi:nitroreductase
MLNDSQLTTPSLRRAIEVATRAPSSHNTQPWIFHLHQDHIELVADRTRALPVNDPFDRELTISCGAALFNIRVSLAYDGVGCSIEYGTDSDDLIARVRLGTGEVEEPLAKLYSATISRQTTRSDFRTDNLHDGMVDHLIDAVALEGANLLSVDEKDRGSIAALVAEGDHQQFSNPHWRRELASWLHPRRQRDGLSTSMWMLPISRLVVRNFDLGDSAGINDAQLAMDAPLLTILSTEGDEKIDWIRAGQALQRMLLEAADRGFAAGYLNQPCQVENLRPKLRSLAVPDQHPQLILRLGEPQENPEVSVRRRPEEVIHD